MNMPSLLWCDVCVIYTDLLLIVRLSVVLVVSLVLTRMLYQQGYPVAPIEHTTGWWSIIRQWYICNIGKSYMKCVWWYRGWCTNEVSHPGCINTNKQLYVQQLSSGTRTVVRAAFHGRLVTLVCVGGHLVWIWRKAPMNVTTPHATHRPTSCIAITPYASYD